CSLLVMLEPMALLQQGDFRPVSLLQRCDLGSMPLSQRCDFGPVSLDELTLPVRRHREVTLSALVSQPARLSRPPVAEKCGACSLDERRFARTTRWLGC